MSWPPREQAPSHNGSAVRCQMIARLPREDSVRPYTSPVVEVAAERLWSARLERLGQLAEQRRH